MKRGRHGYALVVEPAPSGGFGVFAPDLPGCVATGRTREQALRRMREAIALHLDGLREDGQPIPEPVAEVMYAVGVAAAG